jgi:hypothetical protein
MILLIQLMQYGISLNIVQVDHYGIRFNYLRDVLNLCKDNRMN